MNKTEMDTDTMLAILSSLIHPLEFEQSTLLNALIKSDGNVEAAAEALRSNPPAKKKRRITSATGLQGWLGVGDKTPTASASTRPPAPHRRSSHSPSEHATDPTQPTSNPETDAHDKDKSVPLSKKPLPNVKTVTNTELMALLRPPNSADNTKTQVQRFPPLTLLSPEHVAEHTPCTLHNSVLPSELACRLFHTMLHASRDWKRNKWWLFDRVVESPHRTSFFVRRDVGVTTDAGDNDMREAAKFWYNGRETDPPSMFPAPMEEACEIIERIVHEEMRKRKRYPLEWGGYPVRDDGEDPILWRANVAASNCYEGAKESVGFHSDQLTYLGPYPTIASLSLGVGRIFRLKEVVPTDEKDKRAARTVNIPLRHNSLIIMHASTQEVFKHCIPAQNTIDMFHPPFPPPGDLGTEEDRERLSEASNARINITFRFYRPDFRAQTTPRCRCDVPCILRPDMKNRYEDCPPLSSDGIPKASSSEAESSGSGTGRRDMVAKYWWTCYAGAQNDGQGCGFWKVMDIKAEGRGPFVCDMDDQ